MLSTPTTNPYNSDSELKDFSIKIEKFWTLQEKDGPAEDSDEDFDEDQYEADLFERNFRKRLQIKN